MPTTRKLATHAAAFVLSLGLGSAVHSAPIVGEIILNGRLDPSTDLASVSQINWLTGRVDFANGSFASAGITANQAVSQTNFSFASLPVNPLWAIGSTASFNLTSLLVESQDANHIDLSGTGTMFVNGFDATPYHWDLAATRSGIQVGFASTNAPTVPEPGSLLLMGAGIVGLIAAAGFRSLRSRTDAHAGA